MISLIYMYVGDINTRDPDACFTPGSIRTNMQGDNDVIVAWKRSLNIRPFSPFLCELAGYKIIKYQNAKS